MSPQPSPSTISFCGEYNATGNVGREEYPGAYMNSMYQIAAYTPGWVCGIWT